MKNIKIRCRNILSKRNEDSANVNQQKIETENALAEGVLTKWVRHPRYIYTILWSESQIFAKKNCERRVISNETRLVSVPKSNRTPELLYNVVEKLFIAGVLFFI